MTKSQQPGRVVAFLSCALEFMLDHLDLFNILIGRRKLNELFLNSSRSKSLKQGFETKWFMCKVFSETQQENVELG